MSELRELRIRGLATTNSTFDQTLLGMFGYRAHRDGKDWIVPATDYALRTGPPDSIKLHPEIVLDSHDYGALSKKLFSYAPLTFDKVKHKPPEKIHLSGDYGLTSKIEEIVIKLALMSRPQAEEFMSQTILPFMIKEMGATHVAAITANSDRLQSASSLAKIALLIEKFGLEKAQRLVFDERILFDILPNPLDIVEYATAFTIFSPIALTLPLVRHECVWHFYREGSWLFPHAATECHLYQFQASSHPSSSETNLYVFEDLEQIKVDQMWQWLRIVTFSVNQILKFLTDPRSFVDVDYQVDFAKQIQTLAAIGLIFSDLRGMNFSTNSHNRVVYSYEILDKIGNIRKKFSLSTKKESIIVQELASFSQSRWLRDAFKSTLSSRWPQITPKLIKLTRVFHNIQKNLQEALGDDGRSEEARLSRLRAYRNLRHGSFLSGYQFEKLFLNARSNVPEDLATLAVLLTLGLLVDPAGFIKFEPIVRNPELLK